MKSVPFSVSSRLAGDAAVIYPKGYLNNISGESLVVECGNHIRQGITKIVVNFGETDTDCLQRKTEGLVSMSKWRILIH